MAQVAVAPAATSGGNLTAEELREILEYERIVQFRDAVMAGTHPRIKIPPHLLAKQNNSPHVPSPNHSTPHANLPTHPTAGSSSHFEGSSSVYKKSPNNQRSAGGAHIPMSSKAEINPILLEKSDDLIKAEIQLQRQRIERALREQFEQQRLAAKALLQTSESLPNFDISEVLSKALAIVHSSTAAEEASGGAHSSASDSFDENTFYSSQHDTPEPSSPSAGQKDTVEGQSHGLVSVGERATGQIFTQSYVGDQDVVMTGASLSHDNQNATLRRSQPQHSPSSHKIRASNLQDQQSDMGKSDSSDSRGVNTEESLAERGAQRQVQVSTLQLNPTVPAVSLERHVAQMANPTSEMQGNARDLLQRAFENPPASPLLRAHNLSPIAPQPARVSPLATARDPPVLREPAAPDEAHPAQVTALRNNPPQISSTDSSPNRAKGSEKKKEKKKKRKAKDAVETVDTPDSPYIKPEPRSPSPYGVAPLPRPQKRQRQSGQFAAGLNYDEPRQEPEGEPQERLPERVQEVRGYRVYNDREDRYEGEYHRQEPIYRRVEREDDEYRRVDSGQYARRPQSPATYPLPYGPNEVRTIRAASQAIVDRRLPEEPRYYPVRASVRPDADRERSRSPIMRQRRSPVAMAPARETMRIVIDEFGRKYYEPIPAPIIRQSVAPVRYRDPEVIYERAPVRTVSNRLPVEYEEDGVVYRRPASPIAVPRRVVTQPEYAIPVQPEYRSYRQREYSVRPTTMAPPGDEYLPVREAPRRQMSHFEEAPREYVQRAPSVRPEAVRYEIPREYAGRLQSVRPEPPPREYASSVRPEARREVIPQSQREFSVRPMEAIPRRQVPVVDDGRYYEEVPSRRPAEIAFIERPRARESSVLVYADDVRREVYR